MSTETDHSISNAYTVPTSDAASTTTQPTSLRPSSRAVTLRSLRSQHMRARLQRRVNRAKYAAISAAVGAALGGLMSREAASTVAGIGALAGANLGESRAVLTYEELKRRKIGRDSLSTRERWFANEFTELFGGQK